MNLLIDDRGRTVLETDLLNRQWTAQPKSIVINSDKVMCFFPSRINLEYVSDEQDNFYLAKNRVWVTYMLDTKLDRFFPEQLPVDRTSLQEGYMLGVYMYNKHVLNELQKISDFTDPDDLTLGNYDEAMKKLMSAMDEVLYDEKQSQEFGLPSAMGTDNTLELLGSLYALYRAKKRILRGTTLKL